MKQWLSLIGDEDEGAHAACHADMQVGVAVCVCVHCMH